MSDGISIVGKRFYLIVPVNVVIVAVQLTCITSIVHSRSGSSSSRSYWFLIVPTLVA